MPSDYFPSLDRLYKSNKVKQSGVPGDDRAIRSKQSVEEQIGAMELWTTLIKADHARNKANT